MQKQWAEEGTQSSAMDSMHCEIEGFCDPLWRHSFLIAVKIMPFSWMGENHLDIIAMELGERIPSDTAHRAAMESYRRQWHILEVKAHP